MKVGQKTLNSRNILVWACVVLVGQQLFAKPYRVRLGDTLSKIAATYLPGRIYGQNGSLAKLLLANPQVSNANRIFAGSDLEVPEVKTSLELSQSPTLRFEEEAAGPAGPLDVGAKQLTGKVTLAPADHSVAATAKAQIIFLYRLITGFALLESNDSSGAKANAVSNLGFGLALSWLQNWSENFQTWMGLAIRKYSFEISENNKLSSSDFTYSDLNLGFRHPISKWSHVEAVFSYGQHAGLVSTDTIGTMKLETIMTPTLSLNSRLSLFRFDHLDFAFLLGAGHMMAYSSDRIETKNSLRYQGGIDLRYQSSWGTVGSSLAYDHLSLKTINGVQIDRKLEVSLTLSQEF